MILVIIVFVFVFVIALSIYLYLSLPKYSKKATKSAYMYELKDRIMSEAEADFFKKLNEVVKEKYFIFPQVHLSALLNHKINGQNWRGAFRHINGKSVDYVLCDKATLKPAYAIELDDITHDSDDRIIRDNEVEKIFRDVKLPLVRFRDYHKLSAEDIINKLADARELNNQN